MREIPFGKPIIGDEERAAVMQVMQGTQFVHGPIAEEFAKQFSYFVGGGFATSVASCTAGLHLAYFDQDIGPGDEVIIPAQTHVATAHAVALTGADCVFVDSDPISGNIDIQALEAVITERTRAISIVHYLGLPVDMAVVNAIAERHQLFVVEDCALAIGGSYDSVHCGLLGDIGVFSFYPVKHMTTAEGGMVISRHKDVVERINRKKAFGVDRTVGERTVPGVYDVTMLGFNYRMNELEAAIGLEQLKRVPSFLETRAANSKVLRAELAEITEISFLWQGNEKFRNAYYCLSVLLSDRLVEKRFEIIHALKAKGVGTSIYYPVPVPYMSYYKERYRLAPGQFPHASRLSNASIALPIGPHLDEDDMVYIAQSLKSAIQDVSS